VYVFPRVKRKKNTIGRSQSLAIRIIANSKWIVWREKKRKEKKRRKRKMQSASAGFRRAQLRFLTFTRRDSSKSAIDIWRYIMCMFSDYLTFRYIYYYYWNNKKLVPDRRSRLYYYTSSTTRWGIPSPLPRGGKKKDRRQLLTCVSPTLPIYYYKRQGTIIHIVLLHYCAVS